jgi:hypothetical protein
MNSFSPSRGLSLAIIALVVSLLAVSVLAVRSDAQTSGASRTLVLQGGTLIDGTGKAPLENAVIVIEVGRIKAVGKQGEIPFPRTAASST